MTNLTELKKLAEAAYTSADALEEFHYKASPQAILQIIAVMEQMAQALETEIHVHCNEPNHILDALAAYKELTK